jgi:transcriptional regulator with XRE-family HTH domain
MAVLMREAIGDSLRRARTARRRTLREVSRKARVSLGYLSEVERGRKEASSELLAAICEALDIALHELMAEAAEALAADALVAAARSRSPVGLRHMDLRLATASDPVPLSTPLPTVIPLAPAAPTPTPAPAVKPMPQPVSTRPAGRVRVAA